MLKRSSNKQKKKNGVRVIGFVPKVENSHADEDEDDKELREFLDKGGRSSSSVSLANGDPSPSKKEKKDKLPFADDTVSERRRETEKSELRKELIRLGVIDAEEEHIPVDVIPEEAIDEHEKEEGKEWLALPEVVAFQIFGFLSPRDVVWGVELSCRVWWRMCSSEALWERLHRRLFGGNKPEKKGAGKGRVGDELTWKAHCLRSARFHTYLLNEATVDDILRWCCACGHLSLFSRMLRLMTYPCTYQRLLNCVCVCVEGLLCREREKELCVCLSVFVKIKSALTSLPAFKASSFGGKPFFPPRYLRAFFNVQHNDHNVGVSWNFLHLAWQRKRQEEEETT